MRRLARRLFTFCSAVSLLLLLPCVAVCVLWVRSYWVADSLTLTVGGGWEAVGSGPETVYGAYTGRGGIRLSWYEWYPWWSSERQPSPQGWQWAESRATVQNPRQLPVQTFAGGGPPFGERVRAEFTLPLWLPFVVTLAVPAVWTWRRRRFRRQAAAGCCSACGYDLRASPERCPECGTPSEVTT